MEQDIKIFEHEKFGKVRVITINGEPWFVAADVCKALELKNPTDILKRLDDDEKSKIAENRVVIDPIFNIGSSEREINIVNEFGLYRLIMSSRKKEARKFQRWIYHEVLPSIFKYGCYSLVQPAPVVAKPVRVPNPNRVAAQLADASIYVIRVGEEYVKIGNSKNVEERKASLKSWRGLSFGEDYKTVRFPRTIARKIESACQQMFSPYKVEGEIFHVNYETACLSLKTLEQLVENLPLVSNPKFGDKKLV